MTLEQTVLDPQQSRDSAVCFLSERFPQFAGMPDKIPDDLISDFKRCVVESPSKSFLDYCDSSFRNHPRSAVSRIRNLLSVLPAELPAIASQKPVAALRHRSVSVSLTVWVVADMEKNCLGVTADSDWDAGVRYWVRSSVTMAHELPTLFHCLSSKDRLLNNMKLMQNLSRANDLIEFCRERGSLDPSLVKTFLDNKAPALGEGSL